MMQIARTTCTSDDGISTVTVVLHYGIATEWQHFKGARNYRKWLREQLTNWKVRMSDVSKSYKVISVIRDIPYLYCSLDHEWCLDGILIPIHNSAFYYEDRARFVGLRGIINMMERSKYDGLVNFRMHGNDLISFPYNEENLMIAVLGGTP